MVEEMDIVSLTTLLEVNTQNAAISLFNKCSALTLRRFALLSFLECPPYAHYFLLSSCLNEIASRSSSKELQCFLENHTLNSALSSFDSLGHCLLVLAQNNRAPQLSVLLPYTSFNDQVLAAIRSLNHPNVLDLLVRNCKSARKEASLMQSCLVAAIVDENFQDVLPLLLSNLDCLPRQAFSPLNSSILMLSCHNPNLDNVSRQLIGKFPWPECVLEKAKQCWEAVHSSTQTFPATNGTSQTLSLLDCVRANNGGEIHFLFKNMSPPDPHSFHNALCLAAELNAFSACTALLFFLPDADFDFHPAMHIAAQYGSVQVFSRLLSISRTSMDDLFSFVRPCVEFQQEILLQLIVKRLCPSMIFLSCLEACQYAWTEGLEYGLAQLQNIEDSEWKELLHASALDVSCLVILQNHALQRDVDLQLLTKEFLLSNEQERTVTKSLVFTFFTPQDAQLPAFLKAAKKLGQSLLVEVISERVAAIEGLSDASPLLLLPELNDDVVDRIFSFLDLSSLAQMSLTCRAFGFRERQPKQLIRALVQDFSHAHDQDVLSKFVMVFSSKNMNGYQLELKCKLGALDDILAFALSNNPLNSRRLVLRLALNCNDGNISELLDKMLKLTTANFPSDFVLQPEGIQELVRRALMNERLNSLASLLKVPQTRFGGSVFLVECIRSEAIVGNLPSTSLLLATLSRLAMESRMERNAQNLARKAAWESRGGLWGFHQEEEVRMQPITVEEANLDLGIGGALGRAASNGHVHICTSLLKLLKARNRLHDFTVVFQKMFEAASRSNHVPILSALFAFYTPPADMLVETLMTAARNGHSAVARLLVLDRRLIPSGVVSSKFVECARKGHFSALQTLMATGAVSLGTCGDALEECIRRGHVEDCVPFLEEAQKRLKRLEETEEEE